MSKLEKDTDKLMHSLKKATDFKTLFSQHQENLIEEELKLYLTELLNKNNVTKAEVMRKSGITEATGYQYFDGKRKPSREKLIALAIGFGMDVDETNDLLKKTGYAKLYPKHKWDAIVIFGMSHSQSLVEIDELLFDAQLKTFSEG